MWILIVYMSLGYGQQTILMQEFTNQLTCENAASKIMSYDKDIKTNCVVK